jgi:hypothetical protein
METSASFEARYAPLLYPTNQVPRFLRTGADSNFVVDSFSQPLFAPEVFLRRLHGDVAQ